MLFLLYLTLTALFLQLSIHAEEKRGFFFETAGLYWKAQQEGLGYAVEVGSDKRASVKNPSFDWDVGFKAALGYRVPHDTWELLLHYTSLQTHTDAHNTGVLLPVWLTSFEGANPYAQEARMHWRLHLGLLDLLMRKTYHPTSSLTLCPQIGIRTAWIRQKFNVAYEGGNLLPSEAAAMRTKNKFWGIGPDIGLYGQWNYGCGFALFSDAALSIMAGEFYLHQDEDLIVSGEKELGVHAIYRQSAAAFECALGLLWERHFEGTLKRLRLALAWDFSLFFSQNQLLRFVNSGAPGNFLSNQGDLSISGGEFSMRFDF